MTPDAVRALVRDELSRFVDRLVPLLSPCSDAAEYHNRVQLLRGAVAPDLLTEEEAAVAVSGMPLQGFPVEPPEQWEGVLGSELRQGDRVLLTEWWTVACVEGGAPYLSLIKGTVDTVLTIHQQSIARDKKYRRLVRPEPKPARPEWAPSFMNDLRNAVTNPAAVMTQSIRSGRPMPWESELLRRLVPHVVEVAQEMLAEIEGHHA